ncbi:MAG: CBS domain-containing protein [Zoogloea oleivorans]|jgi:CBS domain-containing protein|uniref:CBS domain-containing protein n=1 Tax=Zoogloea oleivorans TaxID=1552750 RepID=UPI002A361406|nr:CBS domain-containing protein [Zoogloea oleivorans]MDY0034826.1 CBS domain-containing protein [Zoogloea oleivorans]
MPNRTLRQVIEGQTVTSALADTSVRAAAVAMANQQVGAIMVVDDKGLLTGLFTERDVLNRVVAKGLDPDKTPLSAVMTEKLLTATPDKPLSHALHMMFEGGFRHVPVVENGKPVGMVSARNALGLEICQFEKELKERDHIAEIL